MRVRITKLRQAGVRCDDARFAPRFEGHLALSETGRTGLVRKLTLHGPKAGAFDGPAITTLYEPQPIHVSSDTFVMRGYERGEGSHGQKIGYVQEWMIEVWWLPERSGPPLGETKPSEIYAPASTGPAS